MPGPKPKPARLMKWRGQWYVFMRDAEGREKRVSCAAREATNAAARRALLTELMTEVADTGAEMRRRGGVLAYDTPLVCTDLDTRMDRHKAAEPACKDATLRLADGGAGCSACGEIVVPTDQLAALEWFLCNVGEREDTRAANPSSRAGLSAGAAKELRDTVERFRDWLVANRRGRLQTGQVDAALLRKFFDWMATAPTRRGTAEVMRSSATINKHRAGLRAAFRWLAELRPPLFPDFPALAPAFKLKSGDVAPPVAFEPATLRAFLTTALEREDPERKVPVKRIRKVLAMPDGRLLPGGNVEEFDQPAAARAATPVSALFLLLALTGARLHEALELKWSDVDLPRGRITFRSRKTGRSRVLPLADAPEGAIAPRLASLLRAWRLEAGDREHVLPHADLPAPQFPKGAWRAVERAAGVKLTPQMLRQSWVSHAASIGIPASVAAQMAGHGSAIAEKWYRQQVLARAEGDDMESTMGLAATVEQLGGSPPAATEKRKAGS